MADLDAPLRLSDHLYVVYSEFPHVDSGNVYLVTGARPTLIDCGSEHAVAGICRNLDLIGLDIADINQAIVTHVDYDHVQGFHGLRARNPAMRLLVNRVDLPIVQDPDTYRTASYVYGREYLRVEADCCDAIDPGDRVPVGDTTLEVIATPGHTEGSICLRGGIDGRGVLFAGDTVGGAMRSLEGASLEAWAASATAWAASLRHLSTLDFDWVLNGHEPVNGLPISRERFDRMVRRFGVMLNPWFSLGEREPSPR